MNNRQFNPVRIQSILFVFLLACSSIPLWAESLLPAATFSHKTHTEDYSISCNYCHYFAKRSNHAGIPSLIDCLGCHHLVKGSDESKSIEIKKLDDHWQLKQPLNWKKLNDLPDFVFFSHQAHTQIGFACEDCHGEVTKAETVSESGIIPQLTMGWCLDCHSKKHVLTKENLVAVEIDSDEKTNQTVGPEDTIRGSSECHACHK